MGWPVVSVLCPKASAGTSWPVRPRARSTGHGVADCPSCGRQLVIVTTRFGLTLAIPFGGHALASTKVSV